jgi:2-hydroxy-3-keto-5-methylthiopentenyl-1-phosphate phosphatase
LVVISGGLQGMVAAVLAPYLDKITAIHAIEVNTTTSYLQVLSRYEGGTELVAKAEIMATYNFEESIAIGDSITDWQMALAASLVFARPPLTQYLDEQHKPYLPWQDFREIRDYLAERIKI